MPRGTIRFQAPTRVAPQSRASPKKFKRIFKEKKENNEVKKKQALRSWEGT